MESDTGMGCFQCSVSQRRNMARKPQSALRSPVVRDFLFTHRCSRRRSLLRYNRGDILMNLRTWLREHTKPTEAELAQHKAQLTASYKQGRLDERFALLAELAAESQAKRAIDLALSPMPQSAYHPGEKLHAYNEANKPGYKPIRLLPAPARQTTDSFPWLPDE